MFNNIGSKIKKLTMILFIISTIIYLILSITLAVAIFDGVAAFFMFILFFAIGFLLSWIGSFFMYAYGELVDNSSKILEAVESKKGSVN